MVIRPRALKGPNTGKRPRHSAAKRSQACRREGILEAQALGQTQSRNDLYTFACQHTVPPREGYRKWRKKASD